MNRYVLLDASTIDGKSLRRYSSFDNLTLKQSFTFTDNEVTVEESYNITDNFIEKAKEMPIELFALSEEVENVILISLSFEEVEKGKFDYNFEILSQNKKNRDANSFGKMLQIKQSHLDPQKNKSIASIIHDLKAFEVIKTWIVESIENHASPQTEYDEQVIFTSFLTYTNNKFVDIFNNLLKKVLKNKTYNNLKVLPQPTIKPTRLAIEEINHLKSKQYKNTFNTENKPDSDNKIEVPITQDIYSHNHTKPVTVTGELKLKRVPEPLKNESVVLFPIDTKAVTEIKGSILIMFDGKVFKAVCTLINAFRIQQPKAFKAWLNKEYDFAVTPQQIYTAMGFPHSRIKEKTKKKIQDSMTRLSTALIFYDWRAEREARHIDLDNAIAEYGKDAVMLNSQDAIDVFGNQYTYQPRAQYMLRSLPALFTQVNGRIDPKTGEKKKTEGYIIEAMPPLFAHALLTGTIATIPLSQYEIKKFDRLSERRNSLISGLAERIDTMKYHETRRENENANTQNNMNYNAINIDNFLKEIGIEYDSEAERCQIINDIEVILNDFKDEQEIIKNHCFKYRKKRKETIEIEI